MMMKASETPVKANDNFDKISVSPGDKSSILLDNSRSRRETEMTVAVKPADLKVHS
jgi:hypothetical protein